jgi:DNA repair protein RadD
VDAIKVNDPSKDNGGDAPAKECPECHALIHAAYQVCPECGYEFPAREKAKHEAHAAGEGILSGEVTTAEYPVLFVSYAVHSKRGAPLDAPKTMRVEYQVSWQKYHSEWICFEHTGYARRRAELWWKKRSNLPVPETAEEAVFLAEDGALAEPTTITVRSVTGEKYDHITGYELGPVPDYVPEPGTYDNVDAVSVGAGMEDDEEPPF